MSENDETQAMAELIEGWLDNPLAKKTLGFFTKRHEGERRIEKILRKYAGEDVDLSLGDRISYLMVKKLLESITGRVGIKPEEVKESLKEGYWRKGLSSVLEGIAWKGPRKPFISYCPFLVVWNFTNACNLNCKHCLDHETDLIIRREGKTKVVKIGELIDELIEENPDQIKEEDGYQILQLDDLDEIEVYSMKETEMNPKPVKRVMRTKANEILKIEGIGGIELKVTPDHELFIEGEWKNAGDLVKEDSLTIPYELQNPEEKLKVNLLEELEKLDPSKIEGIRISNLEKKIKKEAEEKDTTPKELGREFFPDVPESTRDSWLYGRIAIPFLRARELIEFNGSSNLEFSYVGSQGKSLPANFSLSPDLGKFLGYFASEGNFTKNRNRITISNNDQEIIDTFEEFTNSIGYSTIYDPHKGSKRSPQIYMNSKPLNLVLSYIFRMKEDKFPRFILDAPEETKKEFLSAAFSGDGSIVNPYQGNMHKHHAIKYYSESHEFLRKASTLLWQQGVPHYLRIYPENSHISVPPVFYQDFKKKIGFSAKEGEGKLDYALKHESEHNPRWKIEREENKIEVPIASISKEEPSTKWVYDLTVEGGKHEERNYLAGIPPVVVHNCYQNAEKPTSDELSTEEALEVVDEMADAGLAYIAMSGGEPLARDDFFQIAERVQKRDMAFSLATNGTLLTQEKVKKLEKYDCQYIQISVDGKPETHNEFRGSNAFEKTMEGVKNAVDSNITVGIAMTVTQDNLEDVDWVIDKTEEVGADIFMHYNFIPTGRGKDNSELDISPEEGEELLKKLAKESEERDINLLSTAPQFGRICAAGGFETTSLTHFDTVGQEGGMGERIQFLAEFVGGCGTGRLYWALQPNGDLAPCVFLPKKLGNIKEDGFLEVWKNDPFLKKIRKRKNLEDNCGSCEHRNICGGCRARAYGYFDDVQGADPGCVLNQDKWEELKKSRKETQN